MFIGLLAAVAAIFLLSGIRRVPENYAGLVERLGAQIPGSRKAGIVFVIPLIERIHLISTEPFEVSLPPQSAITSDEVPIQLQASLVAHMEHPERAMNVKDWRISTMTALQNLMKDRLEDLDFDRLQSNFSEWAQSVREELEKRVAVFGVQVQDLQVANLSPRQRPSE